MQNRKLLILLLVAIFLKQLVWIALIPMWHTPDEQAHFGQVQNIAEKNIAKKYNSSAEIEISETALGVRRDINGVNKFTYRPNYRIEYAPDSTMGVSEKLINSQPISQRKTLTFSEATGYPPLYYQFSAIGYKIAYNFGLINRLFFIRIWQSLIYMLNIFVFYKLAGVFIKQENQVLKLVSFIAFLPMPSFVASGVTSDNLMNLLFCTGLYMSMLVIKNGIKIKYLILTACLIIIGIYTKPHFLILAPIFWSAMLIYSLRTGKMRTLILITLLCFGFLPVIFSFFYPVLWEDFLTTKRITSLLPEVAYPINSSSDHANLGPYFYTSLVKTYRETLPWFWGIFRWLSMTLDRWYYRILNLMTFIAPIFGFIYALKNIKRKKDVLFWQIVFLLFSVLIYGFVLFFWDYLFFLSHGFSFGIQGRYYFPVIFPIVFLIYYFSPFKKILPFVSIIFNFYALFKIASSYYSVSNFGEFIIQASQYKPLYFKGNNLIMIILLYVLFLIVYLIKLLRYEKND
jgi:hypothetical protein